MFRRRSSREPPGHRPAHPQAPPTARWAAYGVLVTTGVLLLGASPGRDRPVLLHTHQDAVHATHTPATVWWAPTLRELATPGLAPPEVAAHQHAFAAHERAHDVHIRLSPRQLSLAKW